ncbi:MAG TPA: squalene--hopene cyclase [Gemmatimonadales bacterium]|nr:squalene--hopene cyclase [Gemmatimonadales bacterium]
MAIARAEERLLALQHRDGFWSFELEADCTIPAEYVLMMHYLAEEDPELERKLGAFLRAHQGSDGGWALYPGGAADLSATVKVYFALKLIGDAADAPHMSRARELIRSRGGAARCNVFTRITLALFRQLPWRGVPFIPVEVMFLPRWFPFHWSKVSYWSRTVMVPLFILTSLKPHARNPRRVGIRELFTTPPEDERHYFPVRSRLNRVFLALDAAGRWCEPFIPRAVRRAAIRRAEAWLRARLGGRGGPGAIFPAIVNAIEALDCLGYATDDPDRARARQALRDLLVVGEETAYCQPCVSPVWDTALAALALEAVGSARGSVAARGAVATRRALDWLVSQQLLEHPGDWRAARPGLAGGGWPFQFENSHYPDLDDTAIVGYALHHMGDERYSTPVRRAADWTLGMQSRNGGFASFDADNTHYYLNEIPFADHGALLDPPTADVSGRCAMLLAAFAAREPRYRAGLERCLRYLEREQEPEGCWFGRWGTNYIYGTWSVLLGLECAGVPRVAPVVRRAAAWLKQVQRTDGGWGEENDSYHDPRRRGQARSSTAFQTAWALLGLLAAGEGTSPEVRRGIDYLLRTQAPEGGWRDSVFTAPGFPRVFYLKYHGYDTYFPLWALARYRTLHTAREV